MKKYLEALAVIIICLGIAFGVVALVYVIDTKNDCFVYGRANPNLEFHWSFSTACEFQLPDGTWIGTMEYENQKEFEIEQ